MSPSSSGVGCRNRASPARRARSPACCRCSWVSRARDIAQHEEPDDQPGDQQARERDRDQPVAARRSAPAVDSAVVRRGLLLGALHQLRDLLAQVGADVLQRLLLRRDRVALAADTARAAPESPLLPVAGRDHARRSRSAAARGAAPVRGLFPSASTPSRRSCWTRPSSAVTIDMRGDVARRRDPAEQLGGAVDVGAQRVGGAQQREVGAASASAAASPPIVPVRRAPIRSAIGVISAEHPLRSPPRRARSRPCGGW